MGWRSQFTETSVMAFWPNNASGSSLHVDAPFQCCSPWPHIPTAGQSKACHTTFLLAEASNKKLLTPMQSPEPNPNCVICGKAQLLLHADLHALTLGDLITQVGMLDMIGVGPSCCLAGSMALLSRPRRQ